MADMVDGTIQVQQHLAQAADEVPGLKDNASFTAATSLLRRLL